MSDLAKWALLVAGLIAIVAAVVALPIFQIIDVASLTSAVSTIASKCSSALIAARGIINFFFFPATRPLLTVAIGYLMTKFLVVWTIKIVSVVYKWIFK